MQEDRQRREAEAEAGQDEARRGEGTSARKRTCPQQRNSIAVNEVHLMEYRNPE